MQAHEEYRQPQTQLSGYPSGYHLLINTQNSAHDISKSMPAASSGMYAPNAAAIPGPTPQHHQSGQPPATSMVQQQQMNHRPLMINNLPTRPNPPMPSMSRNPMGGVSQPAPQGHQQYPHVQNVMLQPHHNMHAPSMQTQPAPMMITHPVAFFPPRPMQYTQQQYFVSPCYPYPTAPNTAPYFPMQTMQSCPATVNNIPDSQPPPPPSSKKKYLSIINPKTGENVLDDVLQSNAASESRETPRSGGSDAAVKFASQVAAAVASKDTGIHHLNESMNEAQPIITCPEDVSISDSARDSISNEVSSTPEICDQFEDDDILSSRESPGLSFPSKDRLEIDSINDSMAITMDIEQEAEVLPPSEGADLPHSLINHDELSIKALVAEAENISLLRETPREPVVLPAADVETNMVDTEETNCSLDVEKEETVEEPTPIPLQPEESDAGTIVSAGDSLTSSKQFLEETVNINTMSKSEKPVEGKKGKKNKKKDLNKKGESKEGSEMDAFLVPGPDVREQDSTPTPASTPEVVPTPVPPPVPLPTSMPSPVTQSPTATSAASSEPSRDTAHDAALLNSIPMSDETDMQEPSPETVTPEEVSSPSEELPEKKDEGERPPEAPKITLKYEYKEDQWSPLNPEGKKQYDREFLLKLQSQPMSLKKPLNLPNLDVIKDKAQLHKLNEGNRPPPHPVPQRGISSPYDPFMPIFARPGPQKPPHPNVRRSQQGREKPKKVIAFSSSLNQSVKLHESQNAWKPSHKNELDASEEEAHLQELYKRVRGILNKLTPQKFDTLLNQVKELDINTVEKLNGVIDLVFEKAIDEPNFSVPYAMMCNQLAMIKVPSEREGQFVNFRKLLLTKCQKEFEQDRSDEIEREEKQKQIEECEQEDKKKVLQDEFNEEERKNRRRQLGNIRFIGELFKLGMLIEPIMHECIKRLLSQGDEDSLECLCRLLTTIGKELDSRKDKGSNDDANREAINHYFNEMRKIVNGRTTSARVRFMLQDVIDLKSRNWIPRRDENNPKTIDQIHQEAEREAHEQQQMLQNMSYVSKRPSDDNRRKSSNTGRAAGGGGYEDGWIQSSKGGKVNCNFDASKLKQFSNKQTDIEHIQLGPHGRGYMSWGKGSSGGYKPNAEAENKSAPVYSANRYGVLGDQMMQNESRRAPQRSTASSRESSRGRSNQMSSMMRKTPSASKERESLIETVSQLARLGQPPEPKPVEPVKVPETVQNVNGKETSANTNVLKGAELSREDIEKKTRPLMDEFLHNCDFEEAQCCIKELTSPNTMHMFVTEAINQVLERSSQARHMFGQLLHRMMKSNTLTQEQYNKGLASVLEIVDDYALDIPKIWEYLGEIIEPTVDNNPESLSQLKETLRPCIPSLSAGKLVSAILHCAAKTKGTLKVGELWKQSNLQWSDFLPPKEDQSNFISTEKLEFTVCPVKIAAKALPIADITKKLHSFLASGSNNNEEIFDWVEGNISEEGISEPGFVRALITVIFEHAIAGPAESPELSLTELKYRLPLLVRYVTQEELQLEALYAVQALMNKLGQPKGMLRAIFDFLYDDDIISEETFKKWEVNDNPAEQEGKGVALCSVAGFFTWLREADEESEEG